MLVERNLELRDKLDALEQKYTQLENERNVLIGHVRNLQQERENLAQAREEVAAGQLRYKEFQTATEQANEKLGFMTKERDQFKNELTEMKKAQEESQSTGKMLVSEKTASDKQIAKLSEEITVVAKEKEQLQQKLSEMKNAQGGSQPVIKTMEAERAALAKRLEKMDVDMNAAVAERDRLQKDFVDAKKTLGESQATVKALGSENVALNEQIGEVKDQLKKNQVTQKNLAIDLAFARAKEAELMARHQTMLAESDRLKADVQRLTRINEALKDAEQKWQQVKRGLDALRVDSRKMEVKNKKLESKIAKMKILKTRSEKTQEELKALRMLQKEHEAMIGKLTSEKSILETRLARFDAPSGVSPASYARQKGTLSPVNKQRLDMHFNLAVAYDKTKMYKAEEREYMECLRIDPADANVHYNLGILYDDKLNDNAKAIKHYEKYLELHPLGEELEQVKHWILQAEQQERL